MRLRPLCIETFPILIASVAQDTAHSLIWQPALGMLNRPWSSLIFDGAPPVSMNSSNSGQKQSHESVAQRGRHVATLDARVGAPQESKDSVCESGRGRRRECR